MKMYFSLDESGYVTGMSSSSFRIDNEVQLDLEEDHPIFTNDIRAFKYHEGVDSNELIIDEEVKQRLIEEGKQEEQKPTDEEMNAIAILELGKMIMGAGE
ncbi:hypothetical protein [Virgibacillus salexigens]|uniref:hypothetical protein n=1 Tax=Virgibacillus salexigens TaxID=61016 RepID=UPI00308201D4